MASESTLPPEMGLKLIQRLIREDVIGGRVTRCIIDAKADGVTQIAVQHYGDQRMINAVVDVLCGVTDGEAGDGKSEQPQPRLCKTCRSEVPQTVCLDSRGGYGTEKPCPEWRAKPQPAVLTEQELQTIENALPRTHDGILIVPGMTVFEIPSNAQATVAAVGKDRILLHEPGQPATWGNSYSFSSVRSEETPDA